jgi:hypothetical protein
MPRLMRVPAAPAGTEGIYDGTRRIGAVGKIPVGGWWAQAADAAPLGNHATHGEACQAVYSADRSARGGLPSALPSI